MCYFHLLCFTSPNPLYGLPWWLSGKEATCQCRRRGFHSGLGKSRNGNGNPLQHPSPNEMSDPDTTIASLSRVTQRGEDVMKQVSAVHGSSPVWLFSTPWTEARQASLSFAISRSLVRLRSIESVTPSKPSHPLSSPSPPAFSLSQHQGLFQWEGSSHQVAKVLELHHQSFQWIFRIDFLYDWLVWPPCSPRDSPESSPLNHSSKGISSSALILLYQPPFFTIQFSHSYIDQD